MDQNTNVFFGKYKKNVFAHWRPFDLGPNMQNNKRTYTKLHTSFVVVAV